MWMLAQVLDLLFPPHNTAKIVRAVDEETLGALVSPIHSKSGVITLLPYRHRVVRSLIIEAKFRRNARAFQLLGTVLRTYLATVAEDARAFEARTYVLIPIPLGAKRLADRGYNQVEEIAHAGGIRTTPLLVRSTETAPQTSLRRTDRLSNMKDSFTVAGQITPNTTYIVVDDVSTTGATLAAAQAALERAGATSIQAIALAH